MESKAKKIYGVISGLKSDEKDVGAICIYDGGDVST